MHHHQSLDPFTVWEICVSQLTKLVHFNHTEINPKDGSCIKETFRLNSEISKSYQQAIFTSQGLLFRNATKKSPCPIQKQASFVALNVVGLNQYGST